MYKKLLAVHKFIKSRRKLHISIFTAGAVFFVGSIALLNLNKSINLPLQKNNSENVASLESSEIFSNQVLIKIKKDVKGKIKETPNDTGLPSLTDKFKKHKVKKFEKIAKENKNSKKDAEIFSWFLVTLDSKEERIKAKYDNKTKVLISDNPSGLELQRIIAELSTDPDVETVEPNFVVQALQTQPFGKAALVNPYGEGNQYISIPSSSSMDLFPGNFKTVEARFKVKNFVNPLGPPSILMRGLNAQNTNQLTQILSVYPAKILYGSLTNSFGNFCYTEGFTSIQKDRWYHVAVVKSDTGVKTYLDGTQIGSSNCTEISPSWSSTLGIGGSLSLSGTYFFQGYIDEVRFSKSSRYSTNFTPPSEPFSSDADTTALYHFEGDPNDSSSNGNNGQAVGDVHYLDDSEPIPTPTSTPTSSPTASPTPTPSPTSSSTASPTPLPTGSGRPNDPYYSSKGSWGQSYDDLWGLKIINAAGGWEESTGSASIVVANIDTGVDRNHEDLSGNIWVNNNETPGNGIDDDGNGYVDDYYGWDYVNNDPDPMDDHGHGTHTAGTIAAVGHNGIGVVGLNWVSRIMPLKFLGSGGSGTLANAIKALQYAADMGAKVSSNSWGCLCNSTAMDDAIKYEHDKGMAIITAAGNNNADALDFSPASADYAITVAASDSNDAKASFSNWGEKIDVAAPGVDILSTRASINPMCTASRTVGTNYCRVSGTSMATPHVAGLAALLWSKDPSLTNEEVRQYIRTYATDLGTSGKDKDFGYGRIDLGNSLASPSAKPLTVLISSPSSRSTVSGNNLQIIGSALGENLSSYKIEAGSGRSPTSWTTLAMSNSSVSNGLLGSIDTTKLNDGKNIFRITAADTSGKIYQFQTHDVEVDNIESEITYPSVEFAKNVINIRGSALAKNGLVFANYTIDWTDQPYATTPTFYNTGIALANGGSQSVNNDLLGTWDVSNINLYDWQRYALRLRVNATNGASSETSVVIVFDPRLVNNWPKLITRKNCPVSSFCQATPALADIDGDGQKEIIIGSGDEINVFRKDGSNFPNFPVKIGANEFIKWPANIADLDGDGNKEIVVGVVKESSPSSASYNAKIYVVRSDGTFYPGWGNPVFTMGGFADDYNSTPTIANIDNDSQNEILILDPYSGNEKVLHAYHANGTEANGFPKAVNVIVNVPTMISVSDMNKDGQVELVYSSYNQTYLFDNKGNILPDWPKTIPQTDGHTYMVASPATFADIDGDGQLEVFVLSNSSTSILKPAYIYGWKKDGTVVTGFPQAAGTMGSWPASLNSLSAADLNSDGKEEVIVGTTPISIHSTSGKIPVANPNLGSWIHPSLSDLNGDGNIKIAFGPEFVTQDAYYWGFVSSNLVWFGGEMPANAGTIRVIRDPFVIADMDNNGKMEYAVIQGMLFEDNGEDMLAYLWEYPGVGTANKEWPLFMHDQQMSGRFTEISPLPSPTPTPTPTPDTILPTVNVSSPLNGASVSGLVTIQGSAADNVGISKVEFYVDNLLIGTDLSSPYAIGWDTSTLQAGTTHIIYAKAYDTSNNVATSTSVSVTIADTTAPAIDLTNPIDNSTVTGVVNLTANASDNLGVTMVDFLVDGVVVGRDSTAPYTFSWDTTTYKHNTSVILTADAYDAASNKGSSTPVNVKILDTKSPTVNITSPIDNSTVVRNSTVAITASATDPSGISKVEFYVNNKLVRGCSDTTAPYSCNWKVPAKPGITYTLQAKAYDTVGNTATHTIKVTSK